MAAPSTLKPLSGNAGRAAGRKSTFIVFVEPTPYVSRLAQELREHSTSNLFVFFLSIRKSQPWREVGTTLRDKLLPEGTLAALFEFTLHLFRHRPSVVHIAGWGTLKTVCMIFLSRLFGSEVIVSSDTWRSEAGLFRKCIRRIVFWYVSYFAAGGKRQEIFLRSHGIPAERVCRTNMTIDVAGMRRFHAKQDEDTRLALRKSIGLPDNAVVVLFVGRLVPGKGAQVLIRAFERLGLDLNAFLLVVGDGPERANLEALVRSKGRITFLGRRESEELWSLYGIADIFAGPSLAEGWGLVVNEAMAAGLPVIVTDQFGCCDDLVAHKRTGLIAPAGDQDALADALEELVVNTALRQKLGSAAEAIICRWTIEAQAQKVLHLWDKAGRR